MSLSEIIGIAFVVPFIGSIFNLNSSQAPFAEYITNINLSTSLLGVLALSAYISKIVVNVGTLYALNYIGYTIRNIFHYDYFRTYLLDTLENKIKRVLMPSFWRNLTLCILSHHLLCSITFQCWPTGIDNLTSPTLSKHNTSSKNLYWTRSYQFFLHTTNIWVLQFMVPLSKLDDDLLNPVKL